MTIPTTTAAPAPDPQKPPTPQHVGKFVRGDGVTVDRWERPCSPPAQRPKANEREVVYDLDAADEIDPVDYKPRRQRRSTFNLEPSDGGAIADAIRLSNESGVKFRQGAWWKTWGPWIGMALIFGFAIYGYGEPRGWFGVSQYPQTQPNKNSAAGGGIKSERDSVSRDSRPSRGANHSRELLVKWLLSGEIGSMTDEDVRDAERAVEADR